ncbi:MAG TPA: TonB-dependent receptor [Longimicrobiales bacterium]|nr:TonB-dependent receptor [Longimicrobiales bacterium]
MKRWIAIAVGALSVHPSPTVAQDKPFVLDGLVVTASPTPRPAQAVARSVTVLEGDDLRKRGLTRVVDALRDAVGLSVVEAGSFGATTSVFMRGGESDYVQVLVDGVQVNQPGGAFDFAGLTLANVERIEILRGPASSLYGSDAVAGVIQIITRAGSGPPEGAVSLRGGSYGRREASATVSGWVPGAGWSFGVSHLETRGILPFNNAHRNTAMTGSVRLAPDEATRVSLALRLADRRFGFPTDGAGQAVDRNSFTFGDDASVAVTGSRKLREQVELRAHVTLARSGGGTDDQADSALDTLGYFGFTSLDRVQRAAADVRANVTVGSMVATAGVEVEDERQRSFSEAASQWGVTPGRSEYQRGNRAGYAHLTGTSGAVSFGVGGRVDRNQRFGPSGSWNAEVAWKILPSTRVQASVGSALKEPTFFENFAKGYVVGNPDLAPERARSWELGLERSVGDGRGTLRATFFSQVFRDLIEYTSSPPEPTDPNFFNVARARARGLELAGEGRIRSVTLGADWTWLDTRVLDAGANAEKGADFERGVRLLRRPAHTLNLRARLPVGVMTVAGDVRVVGRRDDRDFSVYPAERVALPRYVTVNVGMEAPLGSVFVLSLRGENLLNQRYEEVLGFRAPGRGVYVGARVAMGG